jgi:hypothetical protein
MKIKVTHSNSFKFFPRQYEGIDVGLTVEVEQEIENDANLEEEVKALSNKVLSILKCEIETKAPEYVVADEKQKKRFRDALDKVAEKNSSY